MIAPIVPYRMTPESKRNEARRIQDFWSDPELDHHYDEHPELYLEFIEACHHLGEFRTIKRICTLFATVSLADEWDGVEKSLMLQAKLAEERASVQVMQAHEVRKVECA